MIKRALSYPVFLNLCGRTACVVGAGAVASRKIGRLAGTGVNICVVAPRACAAVARMARLRRLAWARRKFRVADIAGADIVFACTDDAALNVKIGRLSRCRRIFANVASVPMHTALAVGDRGGFTVPAIFRRGRVCVAVSTSGVSAALVKSALARAKAAVGPEYAAAARALGGLRPMLISKVPSGKRRALWKKLASRDFIMSTQRRGWRVARRRAVALIEMAAKDVGA